MSTPVVTPPKPSLPAAVNAASARSAPVPSGLSSRSTRDIVSPWLRGFIYGETNARKTSVCAAFAPPEDVRIILTRGEDQLLPLRDLGHTYVYVDNMAKLRYAMQYPEQLWPDWAARPNRTLIIDDLTRAKDMLLEDNETTDDGKERKDMRMVHREAKADMGDLIRSLMNRPMHLLGIAFAAIYTNNITREESITPDIPPAMSRMLTADFSFCFFIDKVKWQFVTTDRREVYQQRNDKNVLETHTRTTFAKRKIPLGPDGRELQVGGKPLIGDLEQMNLADIWRRIQAGAGAQVKP